MSIIADFEAAGFALVAVVDVDDVVDLIEGPLAAAGVATKETTRLVLLGQVGSSVWDAAAAAGFDGPNRLDEHSRHVVDAVMARHGFAGAWQQVFPGEVMLPLGRLAEHVGWGKPSPMGITIHPQHGPWIAHRFAFVTSVPLDVTLIDPATDASRSHPCDSCLDTPCVNVCPAGAVDVANGFHIISCTSHRATTNSSCALRCVAREACPVGAEHRYGPEQMRHHYGAGLASIRLRSRGDGVAAAQRSSGTNS